MALLEVKNLTKSFGKTEVLSGVDFALEKGEVLCIIGSSGSGKTTLLRCLNFLESADKGSIRPIVRISFFIEFLYIYDTISEMSRLTVGRVLSGAGWPRGMTTTGRRLSGSESSAERTAGSKLQTQHVPRLRSAAARQMCSAMIAASMSAWE